MKWQAEKATLSCQLPSHIHHSKYEKLSSVIDYFQTPQASQTQLGTTLHLEDSSHSWTPQIYSPSPLSHHNPPHARFYMLWRRTFLLSCRTLFRNKSGTTNLDSDLDAEKYLAWRTSNTSAPRERMGVSEVGGGAGSSPKNTGIALDRAFLSLTDITLRSINALDCFVRRKTSKFPPSFSTWHGTEPRKSSTFASHRHHLLTQTSTNESAPSTYFIPALNL